MVPIEEVDDLLKKCAAELGMDYEPEEEKEKTEEQKQIEKIKEWLREESLSEKLENFNKRSQ